MQLPDFRLERFYAEHEFTTRYQLSASDCESLSIGEVLEGAGVEPAELLGLRLGYTESQGDPALRAEIARFYPNCGPEHVVVTNAPEEAIFLAMHTVLGPGDRVVVEIPCYQSLFEVARSIGCDVVPWQLRETRTGWKMDFDQLEALLETDTQLLVVNAPHNPTGHHPTLPEWRRILELVDETDTRLFSDEMYRGLEPDTGMALAPAASSDTLALSLWGMSKSFGLPGLRIGWLACQDSSLLDAIVRMKDYTTICNSAPSEVISRLALQQAEAITARNLALIAENRRAMRKFVDEHQESMTWYEPVAGPVSLVKLSDGDATGFCERARRAEVLLAPGTLFAMDDRYVRFGLGRKDVGVALDALRRAGLFGR